MSSVSVHDEISTNVRSLVNKTLRGQLRLLSATAPSLAARVAEGLFLRTRRFPPRAGERSMLVRGAVARVRRDDQTLRVWLWGNGPTVLLLHGWNGRAGQLCHFVPPLVEAGFRAAAFDASGHGRSSGDSASMPQLAQDLMAVAEAFGPAHGVIAHSLGGLATALALSRGMACQRAVLIAPPAYPARWFHQMSEYLDLPPSVQRLVAERLRRRFNAGFDDLAGPLLARDLSVPALVIHDRQDREIDLEDALALSRAWPGAELRITDGLGHQRILQDPGVVRETVAFITDDSAPQVSFPAASVATDSHLEPCHG